MALRSGAGGQPLPPLRDSARTATDNLRRPHPLGAPELTEGGGGLACTNFSPSPHPRVLDLKTKISAWILSAIVGYQVWEPILGVPSCLPSARETPRRGLAPRGLGLVGAAARQAQVPSPPSPGRGPGRDNGRGSRGPGSPRAGEGAGLGPGAGALPARLGRAEGGEEFLCGSASGAARAGGAAQLCEAAAAAAAASARRGPGAQAGPPARGPPPPPARPPPLPRRRPRPALPTRGSPRGRTGCAAGEAGARRGPPGAGRLARGLAERTGGRAALQTQPPAAAAAAAAASALAEPRSEQQATRKVCARLRTEPEPEPGAGAPARPYSGRRARGCGRVPEPPPAQPGPCGPGARGAGPAAAGARPRESCAELRAGGRPGRGRCQRGPGRSEDPGPPAPRARPRVAAVAARGVGSVSGGVSGLLSECACASVCVCVCARVCVFLSRAIQTCCNSPVNNDSWGLMQINGLQTTRFAHFAAGRVERPVPDFSLFLQICRIWRPCPVLKISQAAIFVFLLSENFNKTV